MSDTTSKNSILIAIGVVAAMGVVGSIASPANTTQILGFCTMICVALLGLLQNIKVAEKLDTTVAAADKKLESIEATGISNHKLANSQLEVAKRREEESLKLIAMMARRFADMPGATPEDEKAAQAAEAILKDHQVKTGMEKDQSTKADTNVPEPAPHTGKSKPFTAVIAPIAHVPPKESGT